MTSINTPDKSETFEKYPVINREPYADFLTSFLNSKAEGGYVINLNAEWGAGKTTFLHCWYNKLKDDHPVVYFDAWKSDFTHDAMMAITESFNSQLMNPVTDDRQWMNDFRKKSTHLLKVALPNLAVGYLKHKVGKGDDESLLADINSDLGIDIDQQELAGALKETMKAMLIQKKQVDGINTFKAALEDLSSCYLEANKSTLEAPIYVLVDELDRCRPTYAIEVIECIKHFFNTKNFVFILATDTDQLQHSIKAVYGSGFDSSSYLSRFFDRTAVLPAPTLAQYVKVRLTEIVGHFPDDDLNIDILIQEMFLWHGVKSLRDVDKILNDIEVAASLPGNFKIICLIILSILKHRFPEEYRSYSINNAIPYRDPTVDKRANEPPRYVLGHTTSWFELAPTKPDSIQNISCYILGALGGGEAKVTYREMRDSYSQKMEDADNPELSKRLCWTISRTYLTGDANGQLRRNPKDYLSVIEFAGHIDV